MKEEVKQTDSVELFISGQLDKFEIKPEDLQQIVDEYSKLEIKGIDDKIGRKIVSEARKDLKARRSLITNKGKELRDVPNKVSKAIIAREKDLIAITQPEEDRLAQMESDIAEEEEELRKQKEYEEQQRIIDRTKELEGYGATFNGVQYELGANILTMAEVRLFTDTEFNRAATFFKEDYENFEQLKLQAELERVAFIKELSDDAAVFVMDLGYKVEDFPHKEFETIEELESFKTWVENNIAKEKQDKADAEAKRIADEALKAEQNRLAEIQKAQDLKQAELDRKQKELDDQLASVKAQKEADEKRAKQLEHEAKVNLFESRRTQLIAITDLIYGGVLNDMDNPMYSLDDKNWEVFLKECKVDHEKHQERLAKEAEEKAAELERRRVEMMPDIEVLKQIAVDLKGTIVKHNMKTKEGADILNAINELKTKTVNYIEAQIKNL